MFRHPSTIVVPPTTFVRPATTAQRRDGFWPATCQVSGRLPAHLVGRPTGWEPEEGENTSARSTRIRFGGARQVRVPVGCWAWVHVCRRPRLTSRRTRAERGNWEVKFFARSVGSVKKRKLWPGRSFLEIGRASCREREE